jgi:hypothetical protein
MRQKGKKWAMIEKGVGRCLNDLVEARDVIQKGLRWQRGLSGEKFAILS